MGDRGSDCPRAEVDVARVLLIGKTGQLARALVPVLSRAGHSVQAMDRSRLEMGRPDEVFELVSKSGADLVVNAAAYTAVDAAEMDRETAFAVNRDGPAAAAAASKVLGSPFIHLSTDYVFDGLKGEPYVETDETRPLNIYGQTKLAGEHAVLDRWDRSVVLRTSWVYSGAGRNFVTTMGRLSSGSGPLNVVNDQIGQPTFAGDLAEGVARVALNLLEKTEADHFGLFHAAGSDAATWFGFAQAIMTGLEARGRPVRPVLAISSSEYPVAARRPSDSRLDCSRLAATHGIRLKGWRAALPAALDDYCRHQNLENRS